MKFIIYIILLNICLILTAETLSFNTADSAPYTTKNSDGFYDVLLYEVFNSLGIDLKLNHYPSARSIKWANEGHEDGEFARISGLSTSYENLIEIKESLVGFNFVGIIKKDNPIIVSSWDDLKNYKVGYLHGWKIYEDNVGTGKKVTILTSIDNMFNMLCSEHLDIILYSKVRAEEYIESNNLTDLDILNTPLSVKTMHLYLNKKHENLVDPINAELSKLKMNGRYDEIFDDFFTK